MSVALQIFVVLSAVFLASSNEAFAQVGFWTEVAAMPSAQSNVAAAAVDGIIYLQGGCCPGTAVNFAYNPSSDTWSTLSTAGFVTSFDNNDTVALGGLIYHIGGNENGFCTSANQVYNPADDSAGWNSHLTPLPTPTCHPGVAVAMDGSGNQLIYVIGGTNTSGNTQFTTVEAYNPQTDTWKQKMSMPTARSSLVAVTGPNGKIYAIGGANNGGSALMTVEAYDPVADSWSTAVAPIPTGRNGPAAAVLSGQIFVVGGSTNTGVPLNTNESYDPSTNVWTSNTPMPTARGSLSLVNIGVTLYATGGGNANGNLATNEAFTLSSSVLNVAPIATITAPVRVGIFEGIALDGGGNVYVVNGSGPKKGVLVFPAGSNGSVAPIRIADKQKRPFGVAVSADGKVYVANLKSNSITVYAAGSTGKFAQVATIKGKKTDVLVPTGIAVDSVGDIFCAALEVIEFAAASKGNVAPIETIFAGPSNPPFGIAVDHDQNIYVTGNNSVTELVALGNDNFVLGATIAGSNTGLATPFGLAVDSNENIYVANFPNNSVTIYKAGSSGNVAPIAIIAGSKTGLSVPSWITLDSTGKIYVSNAVGTVTVYAPLDTLLSDSVNPGT